MEILIIDIETTGFLNNGGKIVEVGMVELNLETGAKKILFDKVVNPNLSNTLLDETWIVKNGYMTTKEIQESKQFKEYKEEIQAIINRYENGATAYNRAFDIDFLKHYGINFLKLLPCPMQRSIDVIKLPPTEKMRLYRPDIKYKTPNAEEAYNHFYPESNFVEKHRGADDALHEADIVLALHKLNLFL